MRIGTPGFCQRLNGKSLLHQTTNPNDGEKGHFVSERAKLLGNQRAHRSGLKRDPQCRCFSWTFLSSGLRMIDTCPDVLMTLVTLTLGFQSMNFRASGSVCGHCTLRFLSPACPLYFPALHRLILPSRPLIVRAFSLHFPFTPNFPVSPPSVLPCSVLALTLDFRFISLHGSFISRSSKNYRVFQRPVILRRIYIYI